MEFGLKCVKSSCDTDKTAAKRANEKRVHKKIKEKKKKKNANSRAVK